MTIFRLLASFTVQIESLKPNLRISNTELPQRGRSSFRCELILSTSPVKDHGVAVITLNRVRLRRVAYLGSID
jgi:hypothetical protein